MTLLELIIWASVIFGAGYGTALLVQAERAHRDARKFRRGQLAHQLDVLTEQLDSTFAETQAMVDKFLAGTDD